MTVFTSNTHKNGQLTCSKNLWTGFAKKKKKFGEQLFGMKKQLWKEDVEMVKKMKRGM